MCTSTALYQQPLGFTHRHSEYMSSIFVILKFKHAHFKFTVYGRKQVCNAVTLMWGLLRLTPINNKEVQQGEASKHVSAEHLLTFTNTAPDHRRGSSPCMLTMHCILCMHCELATSPSSTFVCDVFDHSLAEHLAKHQFHQLQIGWLPTSEQLLCA